MTTGTTLARVGLAERRGRCYTGPVSKSESSDKQTEERDIHPAFRRLPPNPVSVSKPPIVHPRGKDGAWGAGR